MTKLQSILDLANRMISAGLDEIAVAEVLIDQIQENLNKLKEESGEILPVVDDNEDFWMPLGRRVCRNTGTKPEHFEADSKDIEFNWIDEPHWYEEKAGW
jgi:hypothetical protein